MCNVTTTSTVTMRKVKGIMKSDSVGRGGSPGKSNRSERYVNWQGSCRVRPFLMVEEDQRSVIWYASNDYREFKKERKAAATLAKNMGIEAIEETNFVSCRGIEYMVDEERLQNKFDMQHNAAAAVLKAQFKIFKKADLMQIEPDLASNKVIANEYEKFSRQAHFEASQRALQQWKSSQMAAFEERDNITDTPSPQDAMGKPISIEFTTKKKKKFPSSSSNGRSSRTNGYHQEENRSRSGSRTRAAAVVSSR